MFSADHQHINTKPRRGVRLMLSIRKDPLRYFTQLMNEEGAYAWLNINGRKLMTLNDATGIEHVLQKNSENFRKGHFHKVLKPLFGDSMFLNEGPKWRTRREKAAPVFAAGNFEEMVRQMTAAAEAMFERWEPRIARGEPIDMTIEMTRFALDALLRALFHESRDEVAAEMRSSLGIILREAEGRLWSVFNLPESIAHNFIGYRSARAFLRRIVNSLIDARRKNQAYPEDLLSRLVDDFGANPEDQRLLFDEVLSFVLAGHDTTAHGLAWALYSLSTHPAQQHKMETEVDQVLGKEAPTMNSIKRLQYTRQVFDEILRLFPPVWTMSREAVADDHIPLDDGSSVFIPAGAAVMMCHYAVHRRDVYWDNPEAFDPERFSPEEIEKRPKFCWFPFGGGPRLCLGFRFAQVESVLALAMISQRYQLTFLPGQNVSPEPIITLRPQGPLLFRLKKRGGVLTSSTPVSCAEVVAQETAGETMTQKKSKCPFH